ncbi:MAG TPA: phosphate uptake regulator PhoU [Nitrososphaeraceae archaeon]|nr:phosphate uptake regulator PhoU [Nitrososphaeraceae archaeon]
MTRLLDLGIERTINIVSEMSKVSQACVSTAIGAYLNGLIKKSEMFDWAVKLRLLQEEVSDLAFELIARYQPVATDLRYIRSCLEVSYVLARFGGYGYEIVEILDMMGGLSECDKRVVSQAAKLTTDMINISINALQTKDKRASATLSEMDDAVDKIYRNYLRDVVTAKPETKDIYGDPRCVISALLLLRYLERIADHACYIADSVLYIVTGKTALKRTQMNP